MLAITATSPCTPTLPRLFCQSDRTRSAPGVVAQVRPHPHHAGGHHDEGADGDRRERAGVVAAGQHQRHADDQLDHDLEDPEERQLPEPRSPWNQPPGVVIRKMATDATATATSDPAPRKRAPIAQMTTAATTPWARFTTRENQMAWRRSSPDRAGSASTRATTHGMDEVASVPQTSSSDCAAAKSANSSGASSRVIARE